jgi:hypothetical protein
MLGRIANDGPLFAGLAGRARAKLDGDTGWNVAFALRERIVIDIELVALGGDSDIDSSLLAC